MPAPVVNPSLPSAVRRAAKEANRVQAALAANPGQVPQGAQPAAQDPRRAQWTPGQPATPAPSAAAQPVVAPPVVEPTPDPVAVLEHKFNTLAGKYNAETSRAQGMIDTLRAENAALLARVVAPVAPQATNASSAPAAIAVDTSVVSEKERTEYGDELIQMMARLARANGGAEVTRLQTEINQLKGGVHQAQQTAARTLQERVWQQLDVQVPDWKTINISQQFVDWLEIPDIMSGVARKHGLTQAFGTGDGTRVVGIFKRFLEEDSRARPTAQDTTRQAQVDPATLVAPGQPRGTGGEAPNGASGKIWSEQEIDDFYSRVQRKRINPEEAAATEQEILAAVRDGRVIPRRDDRFLANAR
jgi:hypothetical protein